jgi:YD repeat-containing protein
LQQPNAASVRAKVGLVPRRRGLRQYTLAMTYDAIGNIAHKTQKDVINWPSGRVDTETATTYDVGYTYAAARPHAPATVGAQTLSYDADGNTKTSTGTFGAARTLTWDEEDRVASEVDRGFTNTYLYNDQGERTSIGEARWRWVCIGCSPGI